MSVRAVGIEPVSQSDDVPARDRAERAPRSGWCRRCRSTTEAPELDEFQQRVVDHDRGPLLVLAGPGTGKTTTLVESVVRRILDGADPASVLVLTFSRRAAADLRRRITARLGQTHPHGVATPRAMTFHALCHQLVRRFTEAELRGHGVRLLTAPEQDFRVREVLDGTTVGWPSSLAAARPTHAFAGEVRALMTRARQLGLDPDDLVELGTSTDRPAWTSVGNVLRGVPRRHRRRRGARLRRARAPLPDPAHRPARANRAPGGDRAGSSSTSTRTPIPRRSTCSARSFRPAATSWWSATRISRSMRSADPSRAGSSTSRPGSAPADGQPGAGQRAGAHPSVRAGAGRGGAPDQRPAAARPCPARRRSGRRSAPPWSNPVRREVASRCSPASRPEPRPSTSASCFARPTCTTEVPWSDMAVLVRSGRRTIPGLSRALVAAGVPVEVAGDEIPLAAELAVRPLLLALQVAAGGRRPGPGRGHAAAHLAARWTGQPGAAPARSAVARGRARRAGWSWGCTGCPTS